MAKTQLDYLARWQAEQFEATGRSIHTTPKYLGLYAGVAILLVAFASSPWLYAFKLDQDIARTRNKIASFEAERQRVSQLELLKKQVDEGNLVIIDYNRSKLDTVEVFAKIMPLLPSGTKISTLAIQEDKSFIMNMSLPTPIDVVRLWVSLQDSGLFQSIDINTVSLQEKPQTLSLTLKFTGTK